MVKCVITIKTINMATLTLNNENKALNLIHFDDANEALVYIIDGKSICILHLNEDQITQLRDELNTILNYNK